MYEQQAQREEGSVSVAIGSSGDPVQAELDAAMKRLGQLTMENELLVERCRRSNIPFPKGRSRK